MSGRRVFLPSPLVSAAWLADHLPGDTGDTGDTVAVLDVRWYLDGRSGRAAYREGHLPGAVWVDLDRDLSSTPTPERGRHPLPSPEAFAAALGGLGIRSDRPVVAYDDAGGSIAARLWWMLSAVGQPVAVLDGGIAAWPGVLEKGERRLAPVERDVRPWPGAALVDTAEVEQRRHHPGTVLIDARPAARFEGRDGSGDPRPGHIPGARSVPWSENLGPDGRFRPGPELQARYAGLGITPSVKVIASCGSGVTACHDLLALRLAGFDDGALYPGSWSAWSSNPDRPAAFGPG